MVSWTFHQKSSGPNNSLAPNADVVIQRIPLRMKNAVHVPFETGFFLIPPGGVGVQPPDFLGPPPGTQPKIHFLVISFTITKKFYGCAEQMGGPGCPPTYPGGSQN